MPFVVAVNPFDGQRTHEIPVIREAIQVDDNVPMLWCDARHRGDVKNGLIALVELALRRERSKQYAVRGLCQPHDDDPVKTLTHPPIEASSERSRRCTSRLRR